jgi:hypothetical protein
MGVSCAEYSMCRFPLSWDRVPIQSGNIREQVGTSSCSVRRAVHLFPLLLPRLPGAQGGLSTVDDL